jgi:hypothetical protein
MPTKPFYSLEEVTARLGKTADEVKALVREGALREFRDAGKVFFKAEDIDRLAGPIAAPRSPADSGEILLEPAAEPVIGGHDSTSLPSLADSGGGTSIIGLEPLPDEEDQQKKKKEDTVITKSGIGVFDEDELEIDADPMAKTQITTGATDQVSLEGAGSGSGLLDLAREADDTALGADLLDEIYPGEEEATPSEEPVRPARAAVVAEEAVAAPVEEAAALEADTGTVIVAPVVVGGDPAEGIFGGVLVGGLLAMVMASIAIAAALQGFVPGYLKTLGDGKNFWFYVGGAVVVTGIALLVGWFVGKAVGPRRATRAAV